MRSLTPYQKVLFKILDSRPEGTRIRIAIMGLPGYRVLAAGDGDVITHHFSGGQWVPIAGEKVANLGGK